MKNLAAEIVARVRKMPPQSKLEYINALMPLINEYTRKMDADAERRNSLIDGDENYEYQSEQLYHSAQYAKNIGKRREPCSDGPEQCRLREQTRQRIRQNNLKRYEEYYEAYNKAWETLNERRDDEIAADLKKKYLEVEVLKKPDGRRIFISKGRREK